MSTSMSALVSQPVAQRNTPSGQGAAGGASASRDAGLGETVTGAQPAEFAALLQASVDAHNGEPATDENPDGSAVDITGSVAAAATSAPLPATGPDAAWPAWLPMPAGTSEGASVVAGDGSGFASMPSSAVASTVPGQSATVVAGNVSTVPIPAPVLVPAPALMTATAPDVTPGSVLVAAGPEAPATVAPSAVAAPASLSLVAAAVPALAPADGGIVESSAVPAQPAPVVPSQNGSTGAAQSVQPGVSPAAGGPATPSSPVEPLAAARVEPQRAGLASPAPAGASAAYTPPATETVSVTTHPSVPAVPVTPLQPTASASPLTVTPAAPAPATPQAAFAAQVSPVLFTLAGAKPGEHVMTINVAPDNLGPVTVRAHVSVDSVRVELFAPTDAGRDALRAILPDLRRDLAGSGLNTNLDLSSHNQASDSESSRQKTPAPHARALLEREAEPGAQPSARPHRIPSTSTIDVLA